jgi:hypothetical protein
MGGGRRSYRFPKPDEIRWVEFELRSAEHGDRSSPLRERPVDLRIWLARTRDKKTWREIGDEFFRTAKVEARRSEARRAHDRVERLREDVDGLETLAYRLRGRIEELFGVSADEFREFIKTGKVPRPRRAPTKATDKVK